ncbi:hypothetical protein M5K25_026080 [Dendrobium thyrsiflorum]|uniref:RPAP1/MINIYO-like TPR repeats domain-containing protein n=1 Tax=Dendrobium thyrsiflorum TaxID=117978 RepID=A0ABD0TWE3_DENTH
MGPIPALVECLLSLLIGLARHSPTCSNAIFECPRLIQNVVSILTRQGMMELPCQIKAITVLKIFTCTPEGLAIDYNFLLPLPSASPAPLIASLTRPPPPPAVSPTSTSLSRPPKAHRPKPQRHIPLHPHYLGKLCMGDPDVDHGFLYDDQGRVDILGSPFFDVEFGNDRTADEYVDRIIYQLSLAIEDRISSGRWYISGSSSTLKSAISSCMANPELEHGFVYNDQGQVDLIKSPFFDVNLEINHTVEEYVSRRCLNGSSNNEKELSIKVLSQMDRRLCLNFVKGGIFQQVMWHWYRNLKTIDQWVESGKEHCKLTAVLMVEQLRLWKVCISYGYCVTFFADFFPNMCLWLSRPTFSKLLEFNVLDEFAHITREAYLTLGALAEWLPCLHSVDQLIKQDTDLGDDAVETWSWSHVLPMIDLAISWLSINDIPYVLIARRFEENDIYNSSESSMIWVISAVLHMLCCVFFKMSPTRADDMNNTTSLPWLPEFVPKVGTEIVKNRFLSITGLSDISPKGNTGCSLVERLCFLRHQNNFDLALSSLSCLHGLIKLVSLIDGCIQRARNACNIQLLAENSLDMEGKVLAEGVIKWTREDLIRVLDVFGNLVSAEWPMIQSLETFGRGGPAPGVGVGWGSPGGGFWSLNILQAQEDARLVLELFKILPIVHERDFTRVEAMNPAFGKSPNPMNLVLHRVNCVLAVCLVAGPGARVIMEAALNILFQPPVFKYLDLSLHHFLQLDKRLKSFKWQYEDKDYLLFSKILNSHFRERWLSIKTKSSGDADERYQSHGFPRKSAVLETIHEAQENEEIPELSFKDTSFSSFCIQWVHQRMPVPTHWFLSAICSIGEQKKNSGLNSSNELEVAKSGLFFLLCLEALSSSMFAIQESPTSHVSLVWKLHALSMSLHVNMAVLEEERTRDVFESLQEVYGKQLDELRHKEKQEFHDSSSKTHDNPSEVLSFQSKINEGYSTFVENLIEQFGAVSYGDIIFGRQVAIYLHRSVDSPIRLSAWNALSNSYLLELIPPLEMCFSEAEGYLEPPEKHFARGFLLDRSIGPAMLLHLVKYKLPVSEDPLHTIEIIQRFELLMATCEGNSSLIAVVENLKSTL